ncbi:MAG: UvrD-helicase domain-containing protein, partial [Oscillospiraceae bacterium]
MATNEEILNPQQKKAVDAVIGQSTIVTAAAGSGKTFVLVERIIRLISTKDNNIPADSLAIMTFTKNATRSLH